MNNISKFLNLLFSEYANKPHDEGYHLDVQDIPQQELIDLVDLMMKDDTTLRDSVLFHIQNTINSHIGDFEANNRYQSSHKTYYSEG